MYPPKYDAEYEKARNKFIPQAEGLANRLHGASGLGFLETKHEEWVADWNYTFHTEMQRLYKESVKMAS